MSLHIRVYSGLTTKMAGIDCAIIHMTIPINEIVNGFESRFIRQLLLSLCNVLTEMVVQCKTSAHNADEFTENIFQLCLLCLL